MMPMEVGDSQPIHLAFLMWRRGFYAKIALTVLIVCILLYAWDRPTGPANGGTALGYGLGVMGLVLTAWLAWFGIRRRRYGGAGSLEGLLSAHVYLGSVLIVVVSLHAGFRFHWNVHTLAFALMFVVIASGMFGTYTFWRFPELMTRNRGGMTLTTMTAELAALEVRCTQLALAFPDDVLALVQDAVEPARTGQLAELISGRRQKQMRRRSLVAISHVQTQLADRAAVTPAEILPLVQNLTQRLVLMERIYRDWRFRMLMLQWRSVHMPMTVALLMALLIHVVVVFYDW